jgi:FkbM family methyltransferase
MSLKALFYPDVPFDSLFIPWIYKEIYFDGVYVDILNGHEDKKDLTIVDVGSNIGVTVSHFRRFAKKVYGIEPSSVNFEALAKNKEYNGWDNVDITNVAIADTDGEMEINYNERNLTSNSLTLQYGGKKEKVKTMRMDTFFKEKGIEQVDFMKFDVEGAEDMILRSEAFRSVSDKIKAIEVEFHFPTWMQLVEYMVDILGYKARRYESDAIIIMFSR